MGQQFHVGGTALHIGRVVAPGTENALHFLRLVRSRFRRTVKDVGDGVTPLSGGGVDLFADGLCLPPFALRLVCGGNSGLFQRLIPLPSLPQTVQQSGQIVLRFFLSLL